jgi:serine palmitoyltransferase
MDFTLVYEYLEKYQAWWLEEFEQKPTRVFIETFLLIFIIYLLFKRPTNKKAESKLTTREVEDLLNEWEPEPLVNMDDASLIAGGISDSVVIKQKLGSTVVTEHDEILVDFVSFDFLGFSCDDDIKKECVAVLDAVGCGSCGPRGFYGTLDQHLELEKTIADLFGVEESIMYSDSASTVSSVIPAFAKRSDLCIVDESCYDPILTGLFLSRCQTVYFKHNDMQDLERVLDEIAANDVKKGSSPRSQRRFIVLEGIYRNTGDICKLQEIVALKEKHHMRIILDESFSFGVLGKTGRGITEHLNVPLSNVEIICGGLNASCGSVGGFSIGTEPEVVEHQKLSAAGYTYSASAPPFVCKAATMALQKMLQNPAICAKVRDNAAQLYDGLTGSSSSSSSSSSSAASPTSSSSPSSVLEVQSDRCSPICVVKLKRSLVDSIGDAVEEGQNQRENMERAALQQIVHSLMVDHGIFVVASKYNLHHLYIQSKKYNNTKAGPSDPSNTIRLAVSNLHTSAQLEHAVECLLTVSEQVCRDLYDAQAVDVATNESSSSKTSKKKKSSRSKSTGRKR